MKRRNVALIVLALVLGLCVAYSKGERKEHACNVEELTKQVLENVESVNFDIYASDCISDLSFELLQRLINIRVRLEFYVGHHDDKEMFSVMKEMEKEIRNARVSAINEVIRVEASPSMPFNEKERRIHLKQIMSYVRIFDKYRNVPQRDVP